MKAVPARSKTSRPGLSREIRVSCSARNGIVTRSSSPPTKIVIVSRPAFISIEIRPVRGLCHTAASVSGPGGPFCSAVDPFRLLTSHAPSRDEQPGRARNDSAAGTTRGEAPGTVRHGHATRLAQRDELAGPAGPEGQKGNRATS
jgi:hypothetical protein